MTNDAVKPGDVLTDTENFAELNGVIIRKGSIAAFLKNIDVLESETSTDIQKTAALAMLKELALAVIAAGLHKHATFKNKIVEDILRSS